MKVFITCKQAVDFISKKEEHRLSPRQRFELWKHLAVCSLCRQFSRQNRLLIDALKQADKDRTEKLSEADKNAIKQLFI